MRVLIACEFSGRVRDSFLELGHDAWSCDLLPSTSKRRGRHLKCDVLTVLDMGWDLLIGFPDCTYVCNSGLHWNGRVPGRAEKWNGKKVKRWANQTDSGQNYLGPRKDRWAIRALTYHGIAGAMAEQWGGKI